MVHYIIAFLATALVFFGLDFIWLSKMTGLFYRQHIGHLLLDQPNIPVAAVFYLVYVAGIVYFAVAPALNGGSWTSALISGAILGFVAYGTYDMTNMATLKDWSLAVSVVDMSWGVFLTGTAATAGYFAARLYGAN